VLTVPAAMGAAAAVAWVYQFLIDVIPLLLVRGFIAMGFALLLGFISAWALRLGKCRNLRIAMLAGACTGLTALAASHVYEYINMHIAAGVPVRGGMPVWDYVRMRTDTGWSFGRSGSGIPIRGVFVWIIWGAEAALLVLGGLFGVSASAAPFCEACGRWADREKAKFTVKGPSEESLGGVKGATDLVAVLDVREGPEDGKELVYSLRDCPNCARFPTLTVKLRTTVQKGKQKSTTTKALRQSILLDGEEAETVRVMAGGV
jgi:hypothetical protein